MMAQHVNITSLFPVALERARSAVGAVQERVNQSLSAVPPPELIFHYTNDVGLHGILSSGKVWLTEITHLNDPSELQHGIDVALEELKKATLKDDDMVKQFVVEFENFLKDKATSISKNFVCCFSTNGNELSQWRAYADNAKGYALGFAGHDLEQAFSKQGGKCGRPTHPMSYCEKELRDLHGDFIRCVLPEVTAPSRDRFPIDGFEAQYLNYLAQLSATLATSLLLNSIRFKHPAYQVEREYRFLEIFHLYTEPPNLRQRARRHSLVPYTEFDWRQLAPHSLKKIMVGPAADEKQAVSFAEDCLRIHECGDIEIEVSKIPYRAV
jgi:hypothetical protein